MLSEMHRRKKLQEQRFRRAIRFELLESRKLMASDLGNVDPLLPDSEGYSDQAEICLLPVCDIGSIHPIFV